MLTAEQLTVHLQEALDAGNFSPDVKAELQKQIPSIVKTILKIRDIKAKK